MKPDARWQLIFLGGLVVILVLGFVYAIYEPARRGKRVYEAIKPGDSFEDVETLITGRHFCFYDVRTAKGWQCVSSRSEFTDSLEIESTEAVRLHVIFLGISHYRVSLDIECDPSGNVTSVAQPYGWD